MKIYSVNSALKAAAFLFLLAVFSLTWRFGWPWPELKFFELLFAASIALVVLACWRGGAAELKQAFSRLRLYELRWWFVLLLVAPLSGWAYSFVFLPESHTYLLASAVEYARLVFALLVFVFTAYLASAVGNLTRISLFVAAASPLLLWLAAAPVFYRSFVWAVDERLHGPGGDPNYLGSWVVLGLVVSAAFFLGESTSRRFWGWLGVAALLPLLLWTSSHSAILAAVLGLGAVGFVWLGRGFSWLKLKRAGALGIALLLGAVLAFEAAPAQLRASMTHRLVQPFLGASAARNVFYQPDLSTILGNLGDLDVSRDSLRSDRWQLLRQGMKIFISHPFGLGPLYHSWQPVAFSPDGHKLGPHNLFLEVGLSGGYLALLALLYILWFVGKRALAGLRSGGWEGLALFGCFTALFVVSLFLDTLTLRWLWLTAGFIVAGGYANQNQEKQEK